MSRHLRSLAAGSVLCLAVLIAAPLAAGDWSAAQQEVWKNVEAYWAAIAKGDVDGFSPTCTRGPWTYHDKDKNELINDRKRQDAKETWPDSG